MNNSLTPEQKFSRWMKVSILTFVVLFVYFLVADTFIPITSEVTVLHLVTPVSSRISGYVNKIYVKNNQHVNRGDVLFSLDDNLLKRQVESTDLDYLQAVTNNRELDAQVCATNAQLEAAKIEEGNTHRIYQRYEALLTKNLIAKQEWDNAQTAWLSAVQNSRNLSEALNKLKVERNENVSVLKYTNLQKVARLNLSYATVIAENSGTISNLQLSKGWFAAAGVPAMALVHDRMDVVADFREKSIRLTKKGTGAEIAFDVLPGKIFHAHVISFDAGVLDGQQAINGALAAPEKSNRWVRDAQRLRLHLELDEPLAAVLPAGARATVQLYNSDNFMSKLLSRAQISAISVLHYIY
jgi:multidrug resistance efflux pump